MRIKIQPFHLKNPTYIPSESALFSIRFGGFFHVFLFIIEYLSH